MTQIQMQKKEYKEEFKKVSKTFRKLEKRVEAYDREERQLFLLQKNIATLKTQLEKLLSTIEKVELRKKVVKF